MTKLERIFDVWAPPGSIWSPWVKPVLFAHMDPVVTAAAGTAIDAAWAPPAQSTAIVVDLPGAASVQAGWALAERGYRPVPLFSAAPPRQGEGPPAIDVEQIMFELFARTDALAALPLRGDAPPAFLLDSRRTTAAISINPGVFDNRSISFPTDFPSATFLAAHGITAVIVWQLTNYQPQADLNHTLLRWQEAGIAISVSSFASPGSRPIDVERPSRFRAFWHRVLETFGFRRNTLGGFGGTLPEPSKGGGSFG